MVTPNTTLCPSARAEEGALLLGVVGSDRAVRMLSEPEPLTPELTEAVLAVDEPEKHFRFANRCVKSGCNQWHGGRCGVIDLVMSFNQHLTEPVQAEPVQAEPVQAEPVQVNPFKPEYPRCQPVAFGRNADGISRWARQPVSFARLL